jgi:hypothetical protein
VKTDDTLVMMTWDLIKVGSVCGGVSSFMSSSVILLMVKGLEAEAVFLVYYLLACCLMHVSGILDLVLIVSALLIYRRATDSPF